MDTRLGILSGAAFAGVVLGGLLIAGPGVPGALNPSGAVSGLFGENEHEEHEDDDGWYQDVGPYEDDDRYEHEDDDDDEEDDDGRYESRYSSEGRYARDSHDDDDDDHEDDD